ncbi:MBL fold metallo-hydrolase [Stenotrophomonas sp. SY1]|jgi:glyoxylase-like metal-dependent hydrolase (beta-lactamase superfamily II)|uniref:MBL fold metallo-hydrolase n=1 Tax=Stenotrophomonas sp. SY1 TaxID=477235 RepID=UPI001E352D3F|nr:MBL fold metallo-hydrolase [Stenotrophomonas sp. SY1]MCD9085574.1 MBL fold metallo-hydrolase [Stenotrophomonas sp. SY1]
MSVEFGIHTIDTAFQRDHFDAAYLIAHEGRGAFIDCGTSHAVPRLLACAAQAGLQPADIDWLIVTHVHLDHAGGAGALLQELPNARLVVHPRGAPHMIDPARLIAGATAVYGEAEMARSYGTIVPVPEARVVIAGDGHQLSLAGRALLCVDTPGHARHHFCVWDETSRSWFTGDTFGLSYRELDSERGPFIVPTSSPVQFEPEALHASIDRLMTRAPKAMYLTHYGRVQDVARLAGDLHEQIDEMVGIARQYEKADDRHDALVSALGALYVARARRHECALDDAGVLRVLAMDIELNAQGLVCWLERDKR